MESTDDKITVWLIDSGDGHVAYDDRDEFMEALDDAVNEMRADVLVSICVWKELTTRREYDALECATE